jgi:hypothetical protein
MPSGVIAGTPIKRQPKVALPGSGNGTFRMVINRLRVLVLLAIRLLHIQGI